MAPSGRDARCRASDRAAAAATGQAMPIAGSFQAMPISLGRVVEIRALVFDLRDRADDAESVREAGRE